MAVNEALWVIKSVSELFQNRRKKVGNAFFLMHEEFFFLAAAVKVFLFKLLFLLVHFIYLLHYFLEFHS